MHFAPETQFPNPTQSLFVPRSLRSTSIEDMLNNPALKFEDLFDDENFLFELRHGNPRLMDFLSKNMIFIKALIEYITVPYLDLSNNKRACQYPQLANEVFESDIPLIMSAFFITESPIEGSTGLKQDELLSSLFGFVKTKGELNSVLAGYFNKLVLKLYKKNSKKLVQFFFSDKEIMTGFVEHLEEHSLLEVLALFFTYEGYLFDDKNPEYLEIKMKALDRIFLNYVEASRLEQMAHVGEFLGDVIAKNETMADNTEIMGRIFSNQTIVSFFGVLADTKSNQVIVQICNAIIVLLGHHEKKANVSAALNMFASQYFPKEFEHDPFLNAISENIQVFARILSEEKVGVGIPTTYGHNTKTVGVAKLKVIELLEKLVKLGNSSLCGRMCEAGILRIVTNMFAKFVWNNMLHNSYDRLVMAILEKRSVILVEELFERAELLQLIVNETREDKFELPKSGKKIRKGNIGFITKISNELNKVAAKDVKVSGYLRGCPEWDSIVIPALKEKNEMNDKLIGGTHPRDIHMQVFGYAIGQESSGGLSPKAGSYLDPQPENPQLSFTSASEEVIYRGSFEPIVEKYGAEVKSDLPPFTNPNNTVPLKVEENKEIVKNEGPTSFTDFFAMSDLRNSIDHILAKAQKTLAKADNNLLERRQIAEPKYSTGEPLVEERRDGFAPVEREIITFNQPLAEVERRTENPAPLLINNPSEFGLPIKPSYMKPDEGYAPLYQDKPVKSEFPQEKPIKNEYPQEKQPLKTWVLPLGPKRDIPLQEYEPETRSLSERSFDSDDTPNAIPKINSMHDLKANTKLKLRVNRSAKFDGKRILEMIDQYKTPNSAVKMEFSYSENCKAESDIIFDESEPVVVNRILDSSVLLGTKSFKGR